MAKTDKQKEKSLAGDWQLLTAFSSINNVTIVLFNLLDAGVVILQK